MIIFKVGEMRGDHPFPPPWERCSNRKVVRSLANYSVRQDILTGDEVISDSYDMKEIDDVVYEVDCKKITKGADQFGQWWPFKTSMETPELNLVFRYWRKSFGRRSRRESRGGLKASH